MQLPVLLLEVEAFTSVHPLRTLLSIVSGRYYHDTSGLRQGFPVNNLSVLPTLIRVWPDWGQQAGLSRVQAYDCANRMPAGVRIKMGNRVRLDVDRLADWLAKGGNLAGNAG